MVKQTNDKTRAIKSLDLSTPEHRVLYLSGKLWNEFMKVEGLQTNDINAVNENIHRIQDMMYANLYIKKQNKI